MTELLYTDPARPAASLIELAAYLREIDDGGYLYRGQVRAYDAPLCASIYRGVLNLSKRNESSLAPKSRLRSQGRTFYGNYRFDWQLYLGRLDAEERKREHRLDNVRFRVANTFGYMLGSAFAQHYGLKSELLDATTDLNVACFFAVHPTPASGWFHTPPPGVIYRFPRLDRDLPIEKLHTYKYDNAPGTFVLGDLLRKFEADVSLAESLKSIRRYFEIFRTAAERHFELLRFPRGTVDSSRVGRQSAAVLIHDELKIFSPGAIISINEFGKPVLHLDEQDVTLQGIEDLRVRENAAAFYFRHGKPWRGLIDPQTLWPNESDILLRIVAFVLSERFSLIDKSSHALDFIDPGYGTLDVQSLLPTEEEDEYEATVASAAGLSRDEKLMYLIRKAAAIAPRAFRTHDRALFSLALRLCEDAIALDPRSYVLWILKMLLLEEIDRKVSSEAGSKAQELYGPSDVNDRTFGRVVSVLFTRRYDDEFADELWEYYNSQAW